MQSFTLIPLLRDLFLGESPKKRYLRHFSPNYPHPEQVKFVTGPYEVRHQYLPDSEPIVLLPSLEVFEGYGIPSVTDVILLEFIKVRSDATRSNTGVSKLRKVLVQFVRTRERDIVPEALAYAHAAGIKLDLKLTYRYLGWSPSYGLLNVLNNASWTYPLYDD